MPCCTFVACHARRLTCITGSYFKGPELKILQWRGEVSKDGKKLEIMRKVQNTKYQASKGSAVLKDIFK